MKKLFQNQKVNKAYRMVKPWLPFVIIFVVLWLVGTVVDFSEFAKTSLIKSGVMDIDADETHYEEDFNYNFTIKDHDGDTIDMNQFKGKVVFINLWATWCGPCRAEMPSIQSLYDKVNKDKIAFIMLDWLEEPSKVSKFITEKSYTFPVYHVNGDVSSQLNVPSIPTTFVVSPEGKIVAKKAGTANYDTEKFKQFLESMTN